MIVHAENNRQREMFRFRFNRMRSITGKCLEKIKGSSVTLFKAVGWIETYILGKDRIQGTDRIGENIFEMVACIDLSETDF